MTSKHPKALIRQTAAYYDAGYQGAKDVPFFLEYAKRCGGPILELACGTGRVAIELAKEGLETWGIDLSREMLGVLNRKRESLPQEIDNNLHILLGDMSSFDLPRRFELIIIPFRGFQALAKSEEQRSCLECVRKHLTPGGLFIVDVFHPWPNMDESWVFPETACGEFDDPETGAHIRRTHRGRKIEVENQIIYPDLILYVRHPDGTDERIVDPLCMSYFFEDQMRELLQSAGLAIVEEYADFEKKPIGEGPELIFICKKST